VPIRLRLKFYASGTDATYAYAINSSDEVVGEYLDSSNLQHGFYRSAKRNHHFDRNTPARPRLRPTGSTMPAKLQAITLNLRTYVRLHLH
jgi:hypothetical protein